MYQLSSNMRTAGRLRTPHAHEYAGGQELAADEGGRAHEAREQRDGEGSAIGSSQDQGGDDPTLGIEEAWAVGLVGRRRWPNPHSSIA